MTVWVQVTSQFTYQKSYSSIEIFQCCSSLLIMGYLFIGPLQKIVRKSFHSENTFMAAHTRAVLTGRGIIWGYKKPFGDICVLPFFPFMSVCTTAGLNDRAFLGRFMSSDIIAPCSCSKIVHLVMRIY